ncbi:MAG: YeeE/YedE family protein [Bacteroidales bacterium]|nr:YeeE/YedE family protein [Bacteroidales bacterium]
MAPLVPDIIGNEFNLIIALLVGVGFGFVLEQAGFSSTKKLVGLFYGYDFTVLRVFFTAGVTAMIGILLLSHFGFLDVGVIYINPTFLWSAIIGGLIMGGGFIIGGFCPGTSVCAAAIGKLDGWAFVFGSLIGIFVFAEFYPSFSGLYFAKDMGAVRINEFFGLSPVLWAIILTAIALSAFYATTWVEYRVNKMPMNFSQVTMKKTYIYTLTPFVLIFIAIIFPSKEERIENQIAAERAKGTCVFKEISADELAFKLMHNYYTINLIDVRDSSEFNKQHLPLAINIPLKRMKDRSFEDYFKQQYKLNIFYANDDTTHKKACLLAKHLGGSSNLILKETSSEFLKQIYETPYPSISAAKSEFDTYFFRQEAAKKLDELQTSFEKINKPVIKKVMKATGGCS